SFLVVLDDEQRISFRLQAFERIEQHAIVSCMQADRRLIEDVANALQVRSELRRETNALRFAAGQRRRGTIEREIAEPDVLEKRQASVDLAQDISRDVALAAFELQCAKELARLDDRTARELRNRLPFEAHVPRHRIQALPLACAANLRFLFIPFVPPDLLAALLLVEAADAKTRTEAVLAPAVLRVEREQTRIEIREAARAGRTCPASREDLNGGRRTADGFRTRRSRCFAPAP